MVQNHVENRSHTRLAGASMTYVVGSDERSGLSLHLQSWPDGALSVARC
jgi:hypothetical protein